jgi:hypothetical protein
MCTGDFDVIEGVHDDLESAAAMSLRIPTTPAVGLRSKQREDEDVEALVREPVRDRP